MHNYIEVDLNTTSTNCTIVYSAHTQYRTRKAYDDHEVSNFHVNLYMHSVLHMMEGCKVYFSRKFASFNHMQYSHLYTNFHES